MLHSSVGRAERATRSRASCLCSCWLLWWEGFNARASAFHARWVKVGDVLINGLGSLLSQQTWAGVKQHGNVHQFFNKRFGLFVSHLLLLASRHSCLISVDMSGLNSASEQSTFLTPCIAGDIQASKRTKAPQATQVQIQDSVSKRSSNMVLSPCIWPRLGIKTLLSRLMLVWKIYHMYFQNVNWYIHVFSYAG